MTDDNKPPIDENHVIAERRAKLKALRDKGIAFPNDFRPEHSAADLIAAHGARSKEEFEAAEKTPVKVAGRIMLKRVMGKAAFATIQDATARIQLYVTLNDVGQEAMDAFKTYDLGDIVGAEGFMFKTKTGELSVHVTAIRLITKSIRPLPEKFHGLTDTETRYRMRYVDLMVNPEVRQTFVVRSKIVQAIREFMVNAGYLEVETPMMHPIPGGAAARPFKTHHNALDMELYLRIAPELYLKRLVVGGLERVFEINRNFRNEGMSVRHNPEFTMMEFYIAWRDYEHLMEFTEQLLRDVAQRVLGRTLVTYQGVEIDFGKPFDRLTMVEAVKKYAPELAGIDFADKAVLIQHIRAAGEAAKESDTLGTLQLKLFEAVAEAKLIQPTFLVAYPAETSPLSRRNDWNPAVCDRFELFIAGREIANGFSELNDPEDQADRFMEQVRQKDAGDAEAMHYDADYVRALEYGLPPTAGEGIGIDRLVMLLTDSPSIRDVILFPQMRPGDLNK
ncbi:MAG TPA: lysine--tRNA ligase [Usitatibacteraceae bacterium]|nr:lysine--tRNA ligase [Usitatibacteraceae bacterium]